MLRTLAVLLAMTTAVSAQTVPNLADVPRSGRNSPNGAPVVTLPDLLPLFGTKQDVGGNASTQNVTVPGGVARTMAARATDIIQAADYGVKCDGVTNDSPALQAAINAGSVLGGRIVMLQATGHACRLATGVVVSDANRSGVTLKGMAHGQYWPGPYDNNESNWTKFGTWIRCEDLTKTCLNLSGNASAVEDLNFWYTQPTPGGTPCGATCTFTHNWTPIPYPYTITLSGAENFTAVKHITVVNGTNCLNVDGPAGSGVGTIYTSIEDVALGCFNSPLRMSHIDNTVNLVGFRDQIQWYQFNPDVVGYTMGDAGSPGHKVGWDFSYVSGLQATNVEFYLDAIGIRGTEASVQSGLGTVTFAVQAGQWTNISFNQVCRAMTVTSPTTHFNARLTNVVLNVDPQTSGIAGQCGNSSGAPFAFDLGSDNVDVSIANLDGYLSQSIARVGAGNGGALHLPGNTRMTYSAYGPGAPAFQMAAGSVLDMPSDANFIFPAGGAGPFCVGSCTNAPTVGTNANWLRGSAGTARQQMFMTDGPNGGFISRWGLVADNTPENGNQTGSNFSIYRFSDDGSYVDAPMSIPRNTGIPRFPNGLKAVFPQSCSGRMTGDIWNNVGTLSVCP